MRNTAEYHWDNGRAGRCQLEWSDRPPWRLRVEIPRNPAVDVVGQDLFDCLCAARRIMEPSGIRICVNGARQNAWPSRMGSEMGGAGFVYLHKLGKPGHPSDRVSVFDRCACDEVASLSEQRDFRERWIKSLAGSNA